MTISTRFIPAGFDAVTCWPFIFVRPQRRNMPLIELVTYRTHALITPVWKDSTGATV